MSKYTIKHGMQFGKNLTTAQRSSSLFAEEPVVMGRVFRRGTGPMVITEEQYNRNRLQLTRLERAGSIVIVRPSDPVVEVPADLTTAPPPVVPPVPATEPEAPVAPPVDNSQEPTPPVVPGTDPLVENPPVEPAVEDAPPADAPEVKEEIKVEKKSKKGHK